MSATTIKNVYLENNYGYGTYIEEDHRPFYITEYAATSKPCEGLSIVNCDISAENSTANVHSDYLIEIGNDAMQGCEISNNYLWKWGTGTNTSAIKNGTGNYGVMSNNVMKNRLRNESANWAFLVDYEQGWNICSAINDTYGFVQSNNHRRMRGAANQTTALVTFTMPADSSCYLEAWGVWRKQTTASTNVYSIVYQAERDGSGAPTLTQVRRDENEAVAGNDLIFAASGNDVVLNWVAASGENGQIEYGYKVINVGEAP